MGSNGSCLILPRFFVYFICFHISNFSTVRPLQTHRLSRRSSAGSVYFMANGPSLFADAQEMYSPAAPSEVELPDKMSIALKLEVAREEMSEWPRSKQSIICPSLSFRRWCQWYHQTAGSNPIRAKPPQSGSRKAGSSRWRMYTAAAKLIFWTLLSFTRLVNTSPCCFSIWRRILS